MILCNSEKIGGTIMIEKKDISILSKLRKNSRATLTEVSQATGIPISTIFDRLKKLSMIKKHTIILDFDKLGFPLRHNVAIKVQNSEHELVKNFLIEDKNVNTLYQTGEKYDFLFETVHRNMKEFLDFMDQLESRYKIESKSVFYVLDELKKEEFLG
jgi:DNA-binding Lrp family transcriptional regulator